MLSKSLKTLFLSLSVGLLIVFALYLLESKDSDSTKTDFSKKNTDNIVVENFESCVNAGGVVMESYPPVCKYEEKSFTQDIGNEMEKIDLIIVNNPRPNDKVTNPFFISGEAVGGWFFEADFPIKLYDENDNLIGTAIATAQGDWMTEEFVPFTAEMNYSNDGAKKGKLVFEKDNPSDMRELDDQLFFYVYFE